MTIYIGADHRGLALKDFLKRDLLDKNYQVVDVGADTLNPQDDYVDFAKDVAQKVKEENALGIVICGSGVGVCMVANKIKGIRCGQGITPEQVAKARSDDDMNIISLASDYIDETGSIALIEAFLNTKFSNEERHQRRLNKIKEIENHV